MSHDDTGSVALLQTIIRQIFQTSGVQILSAVSGLVYAIVIARLLGPELRGEYFILQSFLGLAAAAFGLSIHTAMTVIASKNEMNLNEMHCLAVLWSLILGVFGALIGTVGVAVYYIHGKMPFMTILVLFIATPFLLYKQMWSAIVLGRKRITILNLATLVDSGLLLCITCVLIYAVGKTLTCVALAATLSHGSIAVIQYIVLYRESGRPRRPQRSMFKPIIRLAAGQHLVFVGYSLYMSTDAIILGLFSNAKNAGLYSFAKGIADRISLVVNPTTMVLFPRISSASPDRAKQYTRVLFRAVLTISLCVAVLMAFLAPELVRLLGGSQFAGAAIHLRILGFAVVLLLAQSPINLWFLGALQKPHLSAYVCWITAFVSVISGICMLIYWGNIGISLSRLFSFFLASALTIIIAKCHGLDFGRIFIGRNDLSKLILASRYTKNKSSPIEL